MATKAKTKAKKVVKAKSNKQPRVLKPLHQTLIKLFTRPNGATMHDTYNAGFEYPVMVAVKMAENHGYKVTKKKEPGELTRYIATKR